MNQYDRAREWIADRVHKYLKRKAREVRYTDYPGPGGNSSSCPRTCLCRLLPDDPSRAQIGGVRERGGDTLRAVRVGRLTLPEPSRVDSEGQPHEAEVACEVCWTISWAPCEEKYCAFVHPHQGHHRFCQHCQLYDQYVELEKQLVMNLIDWLALVVAIVVVAWLLWISGEN